MKRRLLVLTSVPFGCILLCIWAVRSITPAMPRTYDRGERLDVLSLTPTETIMVSSVYSHRSTTAREYQIGGADGPRSFVMFDASVTWDGSIAATTPERVLSSRTLTEVEAAGLDETLAYFRDKKENHASSAYRQYRITYFRAGQPIGEEFFVGLWLPSELAYLAREGFRGDPAYDADYDRLAKSSGVDRATLDRLITFEMLETEPDAPATSESSPAGSSVAPRGPGAVDRAR